jgi:hypothetical protein
VNLFDACSYDKNFTRLKIIINNVILVCMLYNLIHEFYTSIFKNP